MVGSRLMAAFKAAYRQAEEQDAVFRVAIEAPGEHWTRTARRGRREPGRELAAVLRTPV